MINSKLIKPLVLATSLLVATTGMTVADDFSEDEIKQIVREYILENPEIIADAIYILQSKAEQDKAQQETQALNDMKGMLDDNRLDPVGGNPEGTVTLVEFFDYNCGYCKRSGNVLQTLIKDNPNLKVVYKEWPILSETSGTAAKVALAVNLALPDQYETFHRALLASSSLRTENDVWKIVSKLDLDRKAIESKLNSPEVELHLKQTSTLAQQLGITGTPAFIVGDTVLKGAYPIEEIQKAIDSNG